jgi:hypothetical protein
LFAPWFKDRTTWAAWFVFLRALFGLPLAPHQLALFTECTGRTKAPTMPATEAWLVCGRRAGKSFMLALCAVYLACFHTYRQFLQPGERGVVLIVASDRKQAASFSDTSRRCCLACRCCENWSNAKWRKRSI